MPLALRVKPEQIWLRHESYRDRTIMYLIYHSIMTDSSTTEGKLTRENYANSFNKSRVAWVSQRKSRKNFLFMQLCRNKIRELKVWCKGITTAQRAQKHLFVQIFLDLSLAFFPFLEKAEHLHSKWLTIHLQGRWGRGSFYGEISEEKGRRWL